MERGTAEEAEKGRSVDEESEKAAREELISRMMPRNPVYRRIAEEVVYMRIKTIGPVVMDALRYNDPHKVVDEGLAAGMAIVSKLYADDLYRLPEIMMAAKAMEIGISMAEESSGVVRRLDLPRRPREKDPHDIGEGVGNVLLRTNGFAYEDTDEKIPVSVGAMSEYIASKPDMVKGTVLMTSTLKPFPDSGAGR